MLYAYAFAQLCTYIFYFFTDKIVSYAKIMYTSLVSPIHLIEKYLEIKMSIAKRAHLDDIHLYENYTISIFLIHGSH